MRFILGNNKSEKKKTRVFVCHWFKARPGDWNDFHDCGFPEIALKMLNSVTHFENNANSSSKVVYCSCTSFYEIFPALGSWSSRSTFPA